MTVHCAVKAALAGVLLSVTAHQTVSATLTNLDTKPFVLTVTEHGDRTELRVLKGKTVEFCMSGCFVALPNGDRAALTGDETIEISGGRIKAK